MIGTLKEIIPRILNNIGDNKIYELKEYKEQRNKRQNAKYWKLVGELAMALDLSIEEVHFNLLKSYSQRYQMCIPANEFPRGIDYHEKKSSFIKDGIRFNVYYVFVPSHELNTREFAFLLNGLCHECQQQGIETLSPNELDEIKLIIEN